MGLWRLSRLYVGAGCAVLSLDNYNDARRLIDGNFDGEAEPLVCPAANQCMPTAR